MARGEKQRRQIRTEREAGREIDDVGRAAAGDRGDRRVELGLAGDIENCHGFSRFRPNLMGIAPGLAL
jgi:hypothetical protein